MTIAEQIRQKGIDAGREEGWEKGQIAGIASILLKQLKIRFGDVSTSLEQKLGQSNSEKLDKFGESIFSFKDLNDAEQWWEMQS